MNRRTFLAAVAGSATAASAGCLDSVPGLGLSTSFELTKTEIRADEQPDVTVDGETVTVRGTVMYGSSSCGTVDLVHAERERSQDRVDLLVAATDSGWRPACSDDLVETGYRIKATVPDSVRRLAVTEHHVFGETYSTSVDLTDWGDRTVGPTACSHTNR